MKHLITDEEITDRTIVQVNVDAQKLEVVIPQTQGRYLKPVLGAALYNELVLFIQQTTPDTEDPLAKLADQVKDMLCAWAVVEAWPTLMAHVTNAGIVFKNGRDASTTADYKTTQDIRASLVGTAEYYTSELRAWLYEHRADYPTYQPAGARVPAETMPLGGLNL